MSPSQLPCYHDLKYSSSRPLYAPANDPKQPQCAIQHVHDKLIHIQDRLKTEYGKRLAAKRHQLWLISLERKPPATRNLLTIERLQGWSMLAYYPLEHISYLLSHGLIPSTIPNIFSIFSSSSSARRISLDANAIGIWSTRFWALYVLLQFVHLREDWKLLQARQRNLRKGKGTGLSSADKRELKQRWDAYWTELVTNLAYLPLTIHW
ncbi:hypothetical protein C0991_005722 [Blastosporella zonata]|nr:hypothetical protein C0991_005722 [Blastosporella zonata]